MVVARYNYDAKMVKFDIYMSCNWWRVSPGSVAEPTPLGDERPVEIALPETAPRASQ